MSSFQLKNITELFWKSSSTKEEKTPIVKNSTKVPDSGSITKESKMNGPLDSKSNYDSLIGAEANSGETDPNGQSKMSLLRKLCFLLSLNGGVVYVAALLWLIPCRHPLCMSMQNWTVNISGQLTTNMEIKSTPLSSSVFFGVADENGGHLSSLSLANGTMGWHTTTANILKNVFCEIDSSYSGNTNIPTCIVTAYNYIAAINASNGAILWERNITYSSEAKIRQVYLTGRHFLGPLVIAISDEELFLLVAKNGTLLSTIDLPCSETIGVKLVGPWPNGNKTSWTLVCEYGDSLDVWTFLEEEILSLPEDLDEDPFHLLFSSESNNDLAIDLAGDVTRTPNSLAISWANSVVMVTNQAPFHHLRKSWERRFGDTFVVTSVVSGHFINSKGIQVAVTVQEGSNTTLHILEHKNGTSAVVTNLGMRSIMSMNRIAGGEGNVDTLVIESITPVEKEENSTSSRSKPTNREYFTVKYVKRIAVLKNIITAEVSDSSFSQFTEGAANLLISSKSPDSGSIVSRYVLVSRNGGHCG